MIHMQFICEVHIRVYVFIVVSVESRDHCLMTCTFSYFIEKNMVSTLDLRDEIEWDTKTIASAVKAYFR